ncbi:MULTISPECIES: pentapeptide repeat-containing protein [Nocardiaceae]|uniref:Pentapeptide repeat-containing protein n=1 Tax=Rhodococcoides kroppenstedtii TaxID=293050 RepID=A0ABS7NTX9_9NOCA|nr:MULTISPECIES: pentapeptide repeat-containing protein [Rhodococcus]AMY20770.1 hypothetical protein A3Q40_03409 [Rhodococcus sp. PBTS 1]MBY6313541.1 pentapeptide repeat-containing protein [Rhodococcus kroppenstedtii]MBY6321453.1 pentapeptide repeat-containing protein [Rhodococcus kroppenstedtii]MBY6400151.1 pentapeptide repeat-containing protein [Rhodococcus kroppenstedtii]
MQPGSPATPPADQNDSSPDGTREQAGRLAGANRSAPGSHKHSSALTIYVQRHWKTIYPTAFLGGAGLGFGAPTAWRWFLDQDLTPGHGTVIGGMFVGLAAIVAYTGTHLSRKSTERIAAEKNTLDAATADRAHHLAVTQELRARFVTIAAQFADPSTEVRLAAVYALEALTDDWIDREAHHEAQTCINYYCGYLTRPYTPPTEHPHLRQTIVTPDTATTIQRTYTHPHDDLHVRQAITRTIANHTQPEHHHNWSTYDYNLSGAHLHNADFKGSLFHGDALFSKTRFHGERTSFGGARFHGDRTWFDRAQFHGVNTSFPGAQFHSQQTWFDEAQFHSRRTRFDDARFHGEQTSFVWARFHGKQTSFGDARFHGKQTSFGGARFHGEETWFGNARFHGELTWFVDAQFHSQQTSLVDAQFHSQQTLFDEAQFHGELTSFVFARFLGELTSFGGAQFHSKQTWFAGAQFHGKQTSFGGAQFHGERTSFGGAQFHGKQTSFESPAAWNNVYFDWDPQIPYAVKGVQPVNVLPAIWPPTVFTGD